MPDAEQPFEPPLAFSVPIVRLCPFCGGGDLLLHVMPDDDDTWVWCRGCGGSGPVGRSRVEARTLWNTREGKAT